MKNGYIGVTIFNGTIYVHRMIWAIVNGLWPENEIDHKDRDRGNNSIQNLRDASITQNRRNSTKRRNTTSTFKGVSSKRGRWQARIARTNLGTFNSEEDAAAAYDTAAQIMFGEFASPNFDKVNKRATAQQKEE